MDGDLLLYPLWPQPKREMLLGVVFPGSATAPHYLSIGQLADFITAGGITLPLGIADGGTGQVTAPEALSALGGAPIVDAHLLGLPTAPTPSPGDADTSIATTAFVAAALSALPPSGSSVTVSDTAPTSPAPGDLWFDSVSANLFVRYADPDTTQWVIATNQPGPAGATGSQGPAGAAGSNGATGATGPAGSANMSGMTAGQIPVAASATTVTSSLPLPLTVPQGGSGATIFPLPSLAPAAAGYTTALLRGSGTGAMTASESWGEFGAGAGLGCYIAGAGIPVIYMGHAGGTPGSPTAHPSGTTMGYLDFGGYGTSFVTGAQIAAQALETFSATVAGTKLVFLTVTAGALTNVQRLAIGPGLTVGAPTGGDKGAGTLNATSVQANGTVLTSDRRLKRDIHAMPRCLPLVQAVEPKAYRWRPLEEPEGGPADFAEKRRWGFVAQDVEDAARKTHTDFAGIEGGKELGLDAGALIACLWSAVRELSDEVAELKGRRK